jgi:hypothetical protein
MITTATTRPAAAPASPDELRARSAEHMRRGSALFNLGCEEANRAELIAGRQAHADSLPHLRAAVRADEANLQADDAVLRKHDERIAGARSHIKQAEDEHHVARAESDVTAEITAKQHLTAAQEVERDLVKERVALHDKRAASEAALAAERDRLADAETAIREIDQAIADPLEHPRARNLPGTRSHVLIYLWSYLEDTGWKLQAGRDMLLGCISSERKTRQFINDVLFGEALRQRKREKEQGKLVPIKENTPRSPQDFPVGTALNPETGRPYAWQGDQVRAAVADARARNQ